MSLNKLIIKNEYRSLQDNIIRDFYIPLLKESILYERAVGFFSSSSLADISKGLSSFVENNGRIKLIASPKLDESDIEAMNKGYDLRSVIENRLILSLTNPRNIFEEERLNILANLILSERLDIKIALLHNNNDFGMFHEKLGLFYDEEKNIVAFSGSMNETSYGFKVNSEAIDVYCSWKNSLELERTNSKSRFFKSIWENNNENIKILNFSDVNEEIIKKYKRNRINIKIDIEEAEVIEKEKNNLYPNIPEYIQLYDYQTEAISNWKENNYCGIFDMATGTGKTITGISAASILSRKLSYEIFIAIVCPYQHLVEQWVEDLLLFNFKPIIGHSSSVQKNWKNDLEKAIRYQKSRVKNKSLVCFICTNATFQSVYVQEKIKKIRVKKLIIVDEAHNFGSESLRQTLNESYEYRLALSATLERHNDPVGTSILRDFFGNICIEYNLERAIREEKLTQYKYHPIVIQLSPDERASYFQLSREIGKCIIKDNKGQTTFSEKGKMLLLKRARIIASASEKQEKLENVIQNYIKEDSIIVYCGSAKINEGLDDDSSDMTNEGELRQIDAITDLLGNKLNMKVSQFTSRENMMVRRILIDKFKEKKELQVLIAIKCLDEGVNIPSVKYAFILASTTNPKEYIQRRGRVLRLYPGKDYAEIFDFITLPYSLDDAYHLRDEELKECNSLVKRELERANEFSSLAINYVDAQDKIDSINKMYKIDRLVNEEYSC